MDCERSCCHPQASLPKAGHPSHRAGLERGHRVGLGLSLDPASRTVLLSPVDFHQSPAKAVVVVQVHWRGQFLERQVHLDRT